MSDKSEIPIVVLIRSTSLVYDSRFLRAESVMKKLNINTYSFGLLRQDKFQKPPELQKDHSLFLSSGQHGDGIKNLLGYCRWNFWLVPRILRAKPSLIYMCDFDSFLAVTVTKFIQPRVKIIFDEFDPITTRPIPMMLMHVINIVQKIFFNIVDNFIFPSAERIYKQKIESRSFVVNNMPDEHFLVYEQQANNNSIFYGGLLSAERGLETFLKVISNQDIWTVTVAGYGPLEDHIKLLADSHPEVISYAGAMRHDLLMECSAKSSLILATYDPGIGNSLQLASNKYYEAILLKRPILACNRTAIGEKVASEKIGWTFDFNDEEDIAKVLEKIHQQYSELWTEFSANLSKLESEIEIQSARRMLPSIINNLLEVS